MQKLLIILLLSLAGIKSNAQSFLTPADSLNKKRTVGVSAAGGLIWTGSIIMLKYVWYDDFSKSKFHFFDDSKEWGQMDKMGHLYTAWQMSGLVNDLYKWSGVNHKTAAIIGAGYSLGYMTTFEFLDAYNSEWGFSWSDIGFNAIGSLTYFSQAYLWDEQYVRFKFSAQNSGLAKYRPTVLGNDFTSRTLKDYNGQTYWMSFNPSTWYDNAVKFPKWICLSLGYGIANQLRGDGGTYIISNPNEQLVFTPYRQYYLSLDIDFQRIPTRSPLLKLIFRGLNTIKVPFPTLEFSEGGIKFHPLYF